MKHNYGRLPNLLLSYWLSKTNGSNQSRDQQRKRVSPFCPNIITYFWFLAKNNVTCFLAQKSAFASPADKYGGKFQEIFDTLVFRMFHCLTPRTLQASPSAASGLIIAGIYINIRLPAQIPFMNRATTTRPATTDRASTNTHRLLESGPNVLFRHGDAH